MKKRILIIEATGLLGKPVAIRLKESGYIVRVMVRDVVKAERLFNGDYEIVGGNVESLENLGKAMSGCYGVHINLSGKTEQTGAENISNAASKMKLQRITYISGTSVAEENIWVPLIRRKFFAERAIRNSGVNYCIFCPTWFMEILPKYVKGNRAYVFGRQPNPYHLLAADDYARMAAASYKIENPIMKRFIIHGPEGILFHDAVQRYCNYFHSDIKKISTMPYWLTNIIAAVKGNRQMKIAGDFMYAFEKIGEVGDPSEANKLLGAPETKLDEWLQKKWNKEQSSKSSSTEKEIPQL